MKCYLLQNLVKLSESAFLIKIILLIIKTRVWLGKQGEYTSISGAIKPANPLLRV